MSGKFDRKGQIAQELRYGMELYRPMPKILINYDRTAYFDKENPDLRITFDENISYRWENVDFSTPSPLKSLLEDGQVLMEIKSSTPFPLWLTALLSKHKIYPRPFSKYGTAYKKTLQEKKDTVL